MQANALSGVPVLVTGASGFIGGHVCRRLCEAAAEVHALSREDRAEDSGDVRWWQADVADRAATARVVGEIKPAVILHLAGEVTGCRTLEYVHPTFDANLVGTVHLLTAAAEQGCKRFVLAGSMEEPEPDGIHPVPCSPYAAANYAASAYARMFHALYAFPAVILHVFMVYGPAQRDLTKLVPYTILSLLRGRAPRLTSGERPVDWVYVEDVAEAFLAAATADGVEGQTLDIGSGQQVTVREIVERLAARVAPDIVPEFGGLPDRPAEIVRVAHVEPARRLLDWSPRVGLDEGLDRTVAWYTQAFRKGRLTPPEDPA